MKMTFYRGDDRTPDVIKRDGFDLWPLARQKVERSGGLQDYLRNNVFARFERVEDLQRWAVTAKDRERPTVSTSLDQGCGGYDSGFIYQIEFPTLYRESLSTLGINLAGPLLYRLQDVKHFDFATVFALDLRLLTQEVVFFTRIPPENIVGFRPAKETDFKSLPAAAASSAPGKLDKSKFAMFR